MYESWSHTWELVSYNPMQVFVHRDVLCNYFSSPDCCNLIERSKTTTPSLSVMKIRIQTKKRTIDEIYNTD